MLRDDAVARIQRRLGFRSDRAAEIIEALQDAQERLEQEAFLPWFLLSEVANIATADGVERVPIPSDFIRETDEDGLFLFVGTATEPEDIWTELAKDDVDELRDKYPGEGAPKAYALMGDYFRIFPTPDATYTLKQIYYKQDNLLTVNIENKWLKHAAWWMIGEAGGDLAASLGHEKAEARFQLAVAGSKRRIEVDTEARAQANRRIVMGGNN